MSYRVLWDNGHASGVLPAEFDSQEDAEDHGRDWKATMVSYERTDSEREQAEHDYQWEVIEGE